MECSRSPFADNDEHRAFDRAQVLVLAAKSHRSSVLGVAARVSSRAAEYDTAPVCKASSTAGNAVESSGDAKALERCARPAAERLLRVREHRGVTELPPDAKALGLAKPSRLCAACGARELAPTSPHGASAASVCRMNRTEHPIHHSFFARLRDRVLGTALRFESAMTRPTRSRHQTTVDPETRGMPFSP
jgi:hypothetical protein